MRFHVFYVSTHACLVCLGPQVLSNIDELFEREELSAAPDPGWPDCFNSGVFVFKPSNETYKKLLTLCTETGSFDGEWCHTLSFSSPVPSPWLVRSSGGKPGLQIHFCITENHALPRSLLLSSCFPLLLLSFSSFPPTPPLLFSWSLLFLLFLYSPSLLQGP